MRHLDREYVLPDDVDDSLLRLAAGVGGIRQATARRDRPTRLLIREEWRPLWTYLLAILLFPIGLLALLIKRDAVLIADATVTPEGTRLHLYGMGHEVVCDGVLATLGAASSNQLLRE